MSSFDLKPKCLKIIEKATEFSVPILSERTAYTYLHCIYCVIQSVCSCLQSSQKGLCDSFHTHLPTFYCREAYTVRTAYVSLRTLLTVAQPKYGGSGICLNYTIISSGHVPCLNLCVLPLTQETLQST